MFGPMEFFPVIILKILSNVTGLILDCTPCSEGIIYLQILQNKACASELFDSFIKVSMVMKFFITHLGGFIHLCTVDVTIPSFVSMTQIYPHRGSNSPFANR